MQKNIYLTDGQVARLSYLSLDKGKTLSEIILLAIGIGIVEMEKELEKEEKKKK